MVTLFQVLLPLFNIIYLRFPFPRPFPLPNEDRQRRARPVLAAYSADLQGWLGSGERCLASSRCHTTPRRSGSPFRTPLWTHFYDRHL
jgi:hypothetical protein